MKRLTVREVLEVGLTIERNGAEFYEALAGSSAREEASAIYQYLARQEQQHVRELERLQEGVGGASQSGALGSAGEGYLEILAEAHIMVAEGSGARLATRARDHAEATRAAMQFEKDSILLFETMKEMVPESARPTVEALINQEKMHLLDLYHFSKTHEPAAGNGAAGEAATRPPEPEDAGKRPWWSGRRQRG